ncbi:MAG: hypothetical protein H8E12_07755 [Rhodobacteraceae bacterium]|nr:hypothetical protein [Paracoccaceae bacterium]
MTPELLKTKKFVDKWCLDKTEDKAMYEALLNDEDSFIIKEQFAYDRSGKAVITV